MLGNALRNLDDQHLKYLLIIYIIFSRTKKENAHYLVCPFLLKRTILIAFLWIRLIRVLVMWKGMFSGSLGISIVPKVK